MGIIIYPRLKYSWESFLQAARITHLRRCDFFYPIADTSLFEWSSRRRGHKDHRDISVALAGFVTLLVCFILYIFFIVSFILFINATTASNRFFDEFGSTCSRAIYTAKREMRGAYIRDGHRYDRINKFAVLWPFSHRCIAHHTENTVRRRGWAARESKILSDRRHRAKVNTRIETWCSHRDSMNFDITSRYVPEALDLRWQDPCVARGECR